MESEYPVQFVPVQKTTLVESVMEQIIAHLRNGQLRPGSKLPSERALMRMMNVGRSTVREALHALAAMDLIEIRSGEGSRVKSLPPILLGASKNDAVAAELERDVRLQLLDIRQVVEEAVAMWAVERATDADLAAIKEHLDGYVQSTHMENWTEVYKNHRAFHHALAEASHNIIATRVVDSLITTMPRSFFIKYSLVSKESWQEECDIHEEIYAALCARDKARIRAAVIWHMEAERRQIVAEVSAS